MTHNRIKEVVTKVATGKINIKQGLDQIVQGFNSYAKETNEVKTDLVKRLNTAVTKLKGFHTDITGYINLSMELAEHVHDFRQSQSEEAYEQMGITAEALHQLKSEISNKYNIKL